MSPQLIVIKLGTSTLTAGTPQLSPPRIVELTRQMAELHQAGSNLVVVSSGAMAAGRARLGFPKLPKDIPAKQMLAAVGQLHLMALYEQLFGLYSLTVAQVLLTRTDLSDRSRYLNSRSTFQALLGQRIVPIVNENDTVATEEIRVGDNDNLSALVANVVDADLLVLLTDQAGLFTADPQRDPTAEIIRRVSEPEIPEALWHAAGGSRTGLGTGGMATKLQAADLARRSGAAVVIASGGERDVLLRVAAGEPLGTRFEPLDTPAEGRKRFILASGAAPDRLLVDEGALAALARGSSLLPAGVRAVEGSFERGDTVRVIDPAGKEIGRGIVSYCAADLARLCGHHSHEIESILGYRYGDEVVHRNDLVLL